MNVTHEKINTFLMETVFMEYIDGNMNLKEDLGIDSLRLVEVVATLEDMFDIELTMSDLDPNNLTTVNSLYVLMDKYVQGDETDVVSTFENDDEIIP